MMRVRTGRRWVVVRGEGTPCDWPEASMTTHAANQVPTRGRRAAVSVGDPILTSKITLPDVAGWGGTAPADHQADRGGRALVPAYRRHRPSGRGQDDGPGLVGGGGTRSGGLGRTGRVRQPARRVLVLCPGGVAPGRCRHSEGAAGRPARE